jgi:hypothetical protein
MRVATFESSHGVPALRVPGPRATKVKLGRDSTPLGRETFFDRVPGTVWTSLHLASEPGQSDVQ